MWRYVSPGMQEFLLASNELGYPKVIIFPDTTTVYDFKEIPLLSCYQILNSLNMLKDPEDK